MPRTNSSDSVCALPHTIRKVGATPLHGPARGDLNSPRVYHIACEYASGKCEYVARIRELGICPSRVLGGAPTAGVQRGAE